MHKVRFDSLAWELDWKIKNYAAIKSLQFSVLQKCMSMSNYADMRGFTAIPGCAELMSSEKEMIVIVLEAVWKLHKNLDF